MNNSKILRSIGLIIVLGLFALSLAACRREEEPVDPVALIGGDGIFAIPFDTVAELTVFMWSGSGEFLRDVGRREIAAEDIHGQNDANIISVARAFNRHFPNIIINVYARSGGPNADGIPWTLYRENIRLEHGQFPDIFAIYKLDTDVMMGMVADLSIFQDDPMYQAFNPAIMDMLRIDDRLFGLPAYLLPWGIYVNRSLADRENIDIPPINWTIDQFFQFANNSRPNDFYGGMSTLWVIADSGTPDFHWQLANRGPNDPFVRINSQATRNILAMLPAMNDHAIWPQNALGNIDGEFMGDGWWWGARFFALNRLLTLEGDPWMMGDMAHGPDHWLGNVVADWDIFPRPATNYIGNHVGIVLDPMGIRNFAMDDGNPVLSPSEYADLAVAWEFLKFKVGDTRAWEERSRQQFNDGDTWGAAANDSFPVVTGQAFYDQMELWFTGHRSVFQDANRFPGFHRVMELLLAGEFARFSDKSTPWFYEFEGTQRRILEEWIRKYAAENAGASDLDPHWIDELFARLPDWEVQFNQRFEQAFADLAEAVARFYPIQQRGGR